MSADLSPLINDHEASIIAIEYGLRRLAEMVGGPQALSAVEETMKEVMGVMAQRKHIEATAVTVTNNSEPVPIAQPQEPEKELVLNGNWDHEDPRLVWQYAKQLERQLQALQKDRRSGEMETLF